tara:strand:+ start:13091 stop:13726 length:636 start_codon:yes stop_codon:yes gene_type:complete
MSNSTISIFGNKIFVEVLKEIKIFSNYNIKYYDDVNLYTKDAKINNQISVFFLNEKNKIFIKEVKRNNFPTLFISKNSDKIFFLGELSDHLNVPFFIKEFEKKITSLIAKNKFKKNSLINLNNYIVDKNERKIKKGNIELQLSEKEINFLILFSKSKEPVSKSFVLKKVWNYSSESETHTVETHIHRLRKKILNKFNDNNFIKNNDKGYYI